MKPQKILLFATLPLLFISGVTVWLRQTPPEAPASAISQPVKPTASPQPVAKPQPTPTAPSRQATTPLRFAPQTGQTIALRFAARSDSQIDFALITPEISDASGQATRSRRGPKTPVNLRASGELYVKYYVEEAGQSADMVHNTWRVAAKLAELDYRLNDETPKYSSALTQPFALRMQDTGFLGAFQFGKGLPREAEQFIQQLLYSLQTALPEQAKKEWKTKELDMNGRYRARYTVTDQDDRQATLVKQKTEYFTLNAAEHEINPLLSRARMDIGHSHATVTIPLQGAWLLDFTLEENTASVSGDYA